jgi:hypothetical protein
MPLFFHKNALKRSSKHHDYSVVSEACNKINIIIT